MEKAAALLVGQGKIDAAQALVVAALRRLGAVDTAPQRGVVRQDAVAGLENAEVVRMSDIPAQASEGETHSSTDGST